ncbi:hypothetical protein [Acetobacterium woodii]|uniref:Uncharacterized protein n=1 Tax=Acetobacterium woodii (strain ATCC 29683 / DSM 1030 / JCM 2381 / KCTC 1655 / WB1) TaxID=931626 RepID=H6LEY7_ACEWD|nr:hypothetical protein [Acetobacterium woodii]AFA46893.1 hypothetical protein Awo_c00790 [Acetobacterium woodii DSM 1030]
MGKHSEEIRVIDLPKAQCEKRLMNFEMNRYELKNHITENEESLIVLQSKIIFSANGQRITMRLKKLAENKTEVQIRSELISNIQINDRGVNKKNINTMFGYLNNTSVQELEKVADENLPKTKKSFWNWGKKTSDIRLSMMATYLGGFRDFEKSIKGTLAIHHSGIDFSVLSPKFTISFLDIQAVNIVADMDISQNPEWLASLAKDEISVNKTTNEKEKKNKLVIDYQNEYGQAYCIFRADGSFEVEKSLLKAQGLILEKIKEKNI